MTGLVRIGLVGDFDPRAAAHLAIPGALRLAADAAGNDIEIEWLPTGTLRGDPAGKLSRYDGLWCAPGSPYTNQAGAIRAIRFAREGGLPFLGTCGGFQHALLEYARNVLGFPRAASAETDPGTRMPLIGPLERPRVEEAASIRFEPGSSIRTIYGEEEATELCHCRYGLNREFESLFQRDGIRIAGRDREGAPRAVELETHPFFLATLFRPERSAATGRPHPLVVAFLRAAARHREKNRE